MRQVRITLTAGAVAAIGLAGCARAPSAHPTATTAPAPSPHGVAAGCLPSHDGYLRAHLRGAADFDIDWHDADMQCDGSARPDERGVRLTFVGAGPQGQHHIRFVFGIESGAHDGDARNLPANVTVIFEGESRLYSTGGDDKCTIDRLVEQSLGADGPRHVHRISARGFCFVPASALSGTGALLLTRFDFAGLVSDEEQVHEGHDSKT